ncbi:MAG: DUF3261 domain-containing protein [Deferribacteraceae bacterium]|jgi:hypothetical protein|nr:DUF3261 domain-containing protein [Deferribacteraceae bacterium]
MKKFTTLFLVVCFCAICSCAEKNVSGAFFITNTLKTTLMPVIAIEQPLLYKQKLTVAYDGNENTVTAVLNISSDNITVIAFTDFGRIFAITYQNSGIRYELSPFAPSAEKFMPMYIINDIQLIYYPLSAIEKYLPAGITVEEKTVNGNKFRFFYQDSDNFSTVRYNTDLSINFTNTQRNYSYTIEEI